MFNMFKNFASKPSVQKSAKEVAIGIASGALGHVIANKALEIKAQDKQCYETKKPKARPNRPS